MVSLYIDEITVYTIQKFNLGRYWTFTVTKFISNIFATINLTDYKLTQSPVMPVVMDYLACFP